jgi:CheY-like chemotaxis protein
MDSVIPEMDGREAVREIKKLTGDVYIPIIFVTALKLDIGTVEALNH